MSKPKLVLYVRVSTEDQKFNTSIKDQIYKCTAAAAIRGDEIVEVCRDEGWSGTMLFRPGLWTAIQKLKCLDCEPREMPATEKQTEEWFRMPCQCGKNNGASGLIVWDMKRLSRSSKNLIFLVNEVFSRENKGLIIVSGPGECDTRTPQGKFIVSLFGLLAELDREEMLGRMKDAKRAQRREGKWLGGKVPYGFRRAHVKGKLEVNEAESALIVWIMTQIYTGSSFEAVVKYLRTKGVKTRIGGEWHHTAVRRLVYGPEQMYHQPEVADAYARWHETAVINARHVMREQAVKDVELRILRGQTRMKVIDTTGGGA